MRQLVVVLSVVAACGGSGTKAHVDAAATPDAPAIDAPSPVIDAPSIDAPPPTIDATPPAPVTITVFDEGAPIPGADVVWNDATGAVIAHDTTDMAGQVSRVVPGGSSVTAIFHLVMTPFARTTVTTLDVQPGDQLVAGMPVKEDGSAIGMVHATLPGSYPGAAHYSVSVGGITQNADISPLDMALVDTSLNAGGTFNAYALAVDAAFHPLAFSSLTALTPPAFGGTVNATFGPWRTDFAHLIVTNTNGPMNAPWNTSIALRDDHAIFNWLSADGTLDMTGAGSGFITTIPADAPTSYTYHAIAGLVNSSVNELGRIPASTMSLAIDFSHAPAMMTSGTSSVVPSGTPIVSFTAGTPDTSAGTVIQLNWQEGSNLLMWLLAAPAGTAQPIRYPDLPDELAADRLAPSTVFTLTEMSSIASPVLFPDEASFRRNWGVIGEGLDFLGPYTVFMSVIEL
jgi:hypothetical protein